MSFSNTLRWILDRESGVISLEHLRLGPNAPVFLVRLVPKRNHFLISGESHLCGNDTYSAQVMWHQCSIRLSWRVIGPKKNEEIDYHYF